MQILKGAKLLTAFLIIVFITTVALRAWISDDAYITFRTVDHFIEGRGLVWNAGERVQSYTHPLWMLLLVTVVYASREFFATAIILSITLSAALALLVGYRFAQKPVSAWLALVILTLSTSFVDYSTSGLENPLTHLLLAAFLVLYVRKSSHEPPSESWLFWLSFIAALGALSRLDTLLLYGPLLVAAWIWVGRWRSIYALLLGMIPLALWEAFSLLYYGTPFPNTAYAKLDTGISSGELARQGFVYLLQSFAIDPLSAVAIGAGIVSAIWMGRRYSWAAASMLLYGTYIVSIGGDFMAGRFLTPLILLSAMLLSLGMDRIHIQLRYASLALFALVGLAALSLPNYAFKSADQATGLRVNGIVDERRVYLSENGLLTADRDRRLVRSGLLQGTDKPDTIVDCGGVGIRGFQASPYTRVIDTCGLSDALLARLPAKQEPNWRIGHFRRDIPDGYLETLANGKNVIADPGIASLYEVITLVTRGDLFDPNRLRAIWRLNTGGYKDLVDVRRYRYPDAAAQTVSVASETNLNQPLTSSGVYLHTNEPTSPRYIKLGLDCDELNLIYMTQNGQLVKQHVRMPALRFNDERVLWIDVPQRLQASGFDTLHLIPGLCEEPLLRSVSLVDDVDSATLSEALELYFFTYYRGGGRDRQTLLEQLSARFTQTPSAVWTAVPFSVIYEMLQLPEKEIDDLVQQALPVSGRIVDEEGAPTLQYLGYIADPTSGDSEEDSASESSGEVDFFFEPLQLSLPNYVVEMRLSPLNASEQQIIVQMEPDRESRGGYHKASADIPKPLEDYTVELCLFGASDAHPWIFEATEDVCIKLDALR